MKGKMTKNRLYYTNSARTMLVIGAMVLLAACGTTPTAVSPLAPERPKAEFSQDDYNVALELMKQKKYSEAVAAFETIIREHPGRVGPRINLGIAYRELGNFEQSRKALLEATKTNPRSAIAFNELGLAYRKLGDFTNAKTAYTRSIKNKSRYSPAYRNLGILCDIYMQDLPCAIKNYEKYNSLTGGEDKTVGLWIVDLKKRAGIDIKVKKQ
jgi:tetratricopeptide (TPR) repeat protein